MVQGDRDRRHADAEAFGGDGMPPLFPESMAGSASSCGPGLEPRETARREEIATSAEATSLA